MVYVCVCLVGGGQQEQSRLICAYLDYIGSSCLQILYL